MLLNICQECIRDKSNSSGEEEDEEELMQIFKSSRIKKIFAFHWRSRPTLAIPLGRYCCAINQ